LPGPDEVRLGVPLVHLDAAVAVAAAHAAVGKVPAIPLDVFVAEGERSVIVAAIEGGIHLAHEGGRAGHQETVCRVSCSSA
jgi:hypothetical protein